MRVRVYHICVCLKFVPACAAWVCGCVYIALVQGRRGDSHSQQGREGRGALVNEDSLSPLQTYLQLKLVASGQLCAAEGQITILSGLVRMTAAILTSINVPSHPHPHYHQQHHLPHLTTTRLALPDTALQQSKCVLFNTHHSEKGVKTRTLNSQG